MNKAQTVKAGLDAAVAEKPRRLGRGLSSLLGSPVKVDLPAEAVVDAPPPSKAENKSVSGESGEVARPPRLETRDDTGRIVMVAIDQITANRFQPRRRFEEAGLAELAASIRSAGVVQPVLVRKVGSGGSEAAVSESRTSSPGYELVAGERRWRAAKLAGLAAVPAVVADLSDEQAAEWALIENVQRTDLSAMETAYALRELCEKFGLTHLQAAEKLGLDRTSVTNLIRLTDLEEEVRGLLESGVLTAGHGKALLAMQAGKTRVSMAKKAADGGWSVRRLASVVGVVVRGGSETGSAEDAIRAAAALGGGDTAKGGFARESLAHAGMRELEKQLSEHLGTKVQIKVRPGGKRGSVLVQFYDLDHFDGLMGKMGFVMR